MNGDCIDFDQSDVDADEEFEKMRKDLAKARHEFFSGKKHNYKRYGE